MERAVLRVVAPPTPREDLLDGDGEEALGYRCGMQDRDLFALALGLSKPWYVSEVEFDPEKKKLELRIDFERGGTFACPECGSAGCKAYDTEDRTWRHLNFFQYETHLRARLPRVRCGKCDAIRPVIAPWARPGSGFTLLFEALVMTMAAHMPVRAIARLLGVTDPRLWRVIEHYVDEARTRRDDSHVRRVGIDETSRRRGHDYITVFVDVDRPRVLFVTEGKDAETVGRFATDLVEHGGRPEQIREACVDMSAAFIKGVRQSLPQAALTFDKFHVSKLIGDAVDQTRREERLACPELKGQRYTLLRRPETMNDAQLDFASSLLLKQPTMKTARAFHLKLAFNDFWHQSPNQAEAYLKKWCSWAQRSRVPAMVKAAKTIRQHWDGVLRWFTSRITNGLLEGLNSLIQSAKARARGFRTTRNLASIIYIIAGKLDFQLTHL
jgi:transposase